MVSTHRPAVLTCLLTALAAGAASAQEIKLALPAPAPQPTWVAPLEPRILEDGPITVCFAKGTDPRYAAAITELTNAYNMQHFGAPDYFPNGSWSAQGTPRALTWSFVPDGTLAPGLSGQGSAASNLFATMDAAFAAQGGRATWTNRFVQSFARWQQLSGLTYTRVTVGGNDWDDGAAWGSGGAAGARGDVRIGMRLLDGASNVLAFNQFPGGGSDMVLDSGDSGNWASTSNQNRFLRNVVMHEHGHGIGLLHVCTQNTVILMEPFIDTSYDGPRQDDIRGAQYNYGDPFENNNTAATAKPLGALASGGTINSSPVPAPVTGSSDANSSIYSIDFSGKQDWFSFTVSSAVQGTVTVTPVGSTYDNSSQGGSGCPATVNNINTLAIADLAIEVYASNGTTLVASGNASASGAVETLSGVNLGTPGTYYLKIFPANAPGSTQLYRFSIAATSPCPSFTQQPVGGDFCEGALVAMTVNASGAPAPTYQWRKNGNNINGATGSTYAFNGATAANSGTYDCVATNSCSSVPSNPAVIRITSSPEISGQPTNQTVPPGATATFTVISPTPDPLNYQWTQDGVLLGGANSATLTITDVAPENEGTYRCLLNNLCGTLFSATATLTIGASNPCYANCDGSTIAPILNVNDFTCFLNKYAAGDPYANCDGSTAAPVLNVNDFTCFLNSYAVGCP